MRIEKTRMTGREKDKSWQEEGKTEEILKIIIVGSRNLLGAAETSESTARTLESKENDWIETTTGNTHAGLSGNRVAAAKTEKQRRVKPAACWRYST